MKLFSHYMHIKVKSYRMCAILLFTGLFYILFNKKTRKKNNKNMKTMKTSHTRKFLNILKIIV